MWSNTFKRVTAVIASFVPLLTANSAFAEATERSGINLRQGVTDISHQVYELHMIVFWLCVGIAVIVFGVMIYSIIVHRKSRGVVPAKFHESTKVEIIWTTIPFVVLVALAVPATQTLLALEDTRDSEMTIKITGYQWKWKYEYPAENISFFSVLSTPRDQIEGRAEKGEHYLLEVDNPIVIPTKKKIRFVMTSNDVIHSWWVPDLGWKQDTIPGFINDAWTEVPEPGTYRGQCAELCGKDHGFMPIVLIAMNQPEFDQWVADQHAASAVAAEASAAASDRTWEMDELIAQGESVYNTNCAACHRESGDGIPGVYPAIRGSKIATGPLSGHLDMVMNGSQTNPAMAAWGPQLSDADLAAVITFQRNAFDNNTGDVVQPADIKAAR